MISNILVVLLVLLAIYSKIHDGQMDMLFRLEDLYLVVGALLGLVVLHFMTKRRAAPPTNQKKGNK